MIHNDVPLAKSKTRKVQAFSHPGGFRGSLPNNPFEAVETRDLGFFSPPLLCAINKKPREKSSFVNDCDLSLVSKQINATRA